MSARAFLLCLLSLSPLLIRAADDPTLAAITAGVIAKDEANDKELHRSQFHLCQKTDRLDDQGKVTQHQEIVMLVRPGAQPEVQVLSEKGDDLPTNPDQAKMAADGQKAEQQQVRIALKDLLGRFNVTLAGREIFEKQDCHVLAFSPKPDQPYHNQTEKVLNHLEGRMWVSVRDYAVLQTDAHLAEPVQVAWVFAKVSALHFHYRLDDITGKLGPAHVETEVKVDLPLMTIRQRSTVDLTQFEPRKDAPGLVIPPR